MKTKIQTKLSLIGPKLCNNYIASNLFLLDDDPTRRVKHICRPSLPYSSSWSGLQRSCTACLNKTKNGHKMHRHSALIQDRNHASSNNYQIILLSFSLSFSRSATVQTLLSQRAWIWEHKVDLV